MNIKQSQKDLFYYINIMTIYLILIFVMIYDIAICNLFF